MTTELTWLGHATWLIESDGHRILVDPFLADNPAAQVQPDDIQVDTILITHGHFDHVADAASIANRCAATLVANFEIATWFEANHGVKNTLGMNLGGNAKLPFGDVKMTLAHHSSQLPDGSYGGNPGGFVVKLQNKRIFFAGDTALFSDLRLIGEMGLDAAILPIGDLFTMGIDDSITAAKWLNAKQVFPAHYNTWPPIEQDADLWARKLSSEVPDSTPRVLKVGETVTL